MAKYTGHGGYGVGVDKIVKCTAVKIAFRAGEIVSMVASVGLDMWIGPSQSVGVKNLIIRCLRECRVEECVGA